MTKNTDPNNPEVETLTKQERFFYENGGYSVAQGETQGQGKIRSAKEHANAETWALQEGYTFEIEPDAYADESFMDDETQEYQDEWRGKAWQTLMYGPGGNIVQSLGGSYGDAHYKRVVKAELALEEMKSVVRESRLVGVTA